tara:strand:+ start:915 stop:2639 length:1725 start_codon:yes stop_codon:yes gene_type:complete
MNEFFTKEDLSTSAKEIKKTLAEQHTSEIGQSQILSILAKSIGFDSYKDFIHGTGYVRYSSLDLITIKEKEEKIIKNLSKYGVIKTIKMIENYRNKQRKNFNENTYTYNLVEYMKIYDELNNRKISENIIDTFDKAYDKVPELVSDIVKRYKDYPFYLNIKKDLLSNNTKLTTEDIAKYKEMSAIKRKINKNEDLTIVDELIIELLYLRDSFSDYEDKTNRDDSHIIKKYRKEIVRLRGLHEAKSNYENLASEIDTYFFESSEPNSQAIVQEYKENVKKDSILLGTLEKKEKKGFLGLLKTKTTSENYYVPRLNNESILVGGYYSSRVLLNSFFIDSILNKEQCFYFNFSGDKAELAKQAEALRYLNYNSKIIYLSYEEFLILSKEKIDYYLKKKKTVHVLTTDLEKTIAENGYKLASKLNFFINYVGKKEKKDKVNIFVTSSDYLTHSNNIHSKKLIETMISHKENFNNTNILFQSSFREFLRYTFQENKEYFNSFDDVYIMQSIFYEYPYNLMPERGKEWQERFIETLKNMNTFEFIHLKNKDKIIDEEFNVYKPKYFNLSMNVNIDFDKNE